MMKITLAVLVAAIVVLVFFTFYDVRKWMRESKNRFEESIRDVEARMLRKMKDSQAPNLKRQRQPTRLSFDDLDDLHEGWLEVNADSVINSQSCDESDLTPLTSKTTPESNEVQATAQATKTQSELEAIDETVTKEEPPVTTTTQSESTEESNEVQATAQATTQSETTDEAETVTDEAEEPPVVEVTPGQPVELPPQRRATRKSKTTLRS